MLQKSALPRLSEDMEMSDNGSTPSPTRTTPTSDKVTRTEISSNIDPALSGVTSPSAESESGETAEDKAQGAWIDSIRVIEALRKFISDRLEREEYEIDDEENSTENMDSKILKPGPSQRANGESLYPVLRTDID